MSFYVITQVAIGAVSVYHADLYSCKYLTSTLKTFKKGTFVMEHVPILKSEITKLRLVN